MGFKVKQTYFNRHNALEKDIERGILEYLSTLPNTFCWKVNNVGVFDPIKKIYRLPKSKFILRGQADIQGLWRGIFIAIEVKRHKTKGNVSEHQERYLQMINNHGGLAFIATSIEEVKQELERYERSKHGSSANALQERDLKMEGEAPQL